MMDTHLIIQNIVYTKPINSYISEIVADTCTLAKVDPELILKKTRKDIPPKMRAKGNVLFRDLRRCSQYRM